MTKIKYLTTDQVALVRSIANQPTIHAIVETLLGTGVRVSELVAIRQSDINYSARTITVKTLKRDNHYRSIDISSRLSDILRLYCNSMKMQGNRRIFPFTRQAINKMLNQLGNKLEFSLYPHKFRHTYAIHTLRKTKNIRYVQKQLGHSSIQTTEIYLDYVEFDEEKKELEGLYR